MNRRQMAKTMNQLEGLHPWIYPAKAVKLVVCSISDGSRSRGWHFSENVLLLATASRCYSPLQRTPFSSPCKSSGMRGIMICHHKSTPKLKGVALYALLCMALFFVFEAAYEFAWLPLSAQGRDSPIVTQSYKEHFWSLAAKLPRLSHSLDSPYKYNTMGLTANEPPPYDRASIGKCTSLFGAHDYVFYRALDTHIERNQLHRYPAYVLDRPILDGLWSMHAALLEVMLLEMTKSEKHRLQWLAWFDADTIILSRLIPLETFLPPSDMSNIHAVVTRDWQGLNNGVFYLRVCKWSIELLAATIAYRRYRPDEELQFSEQTAKEHLLGENGFVDGVVLVPSRWFNAYPGASMGVYTGAHEPYQVHNGDMALHLPGVGDDKSTPIQDWLYELAENRTLWEVPVAATNLTLEVESFWADVRATRDLGS